MAAKKSAVAKSTKTAPRMAARPARSAAGEAPVTIDRRRTSRRGDELDAAEPAAAPALERRQKVARRRQIDPTTCERDYSIEEVEFMNAMDEYKRTSGRMFPTCSEVLEVIRGIGYVKLSASERALLAAEQSLSARIDAVTDAVESLIEETL